jgi:hypothetical protein
VNVAVADGLAVAVGVGVGDGPDCAQYRPPVLKTLGNPVSPPQTIISVLLQTAVCMDRADGALAVLVPVQLSVPGSYLPPVLKKLPVPADPPQMIISLSVHTAV